MGLQPVSRGSGSALLHVRFPSSPGSFGECSSSSFKGHEVSSPTPQNEPAALSVVGLWSLRSFTQTSHLFQRSKAAGPD